MHTLVSTLQTIHAHAHGQKKRWYTTDTSSHRIDDESAPTTESFHMSDHSRARSPPSPPSPPFPRPRPTTPRGRAPSPTGRARHYPHADAFQDVHDVHLSDDAQGASRGEGCGGTCDRRARERDARANPTRARGEEGISRRAVSIFPPRGAIDRAHVIHKCDRGGVMCGVWDGG